MHFFIVSLVASTYGENSYGECAYNEGCANPSTPGSDPGSGLSDTGVWIVGLLTLACLLIFATLLARWLARRNRKPSYRAAASNVTARRNKS
jgi:hypothetical protein